MNSDWQARRLIPGQGSNNPAAARGAFDDLSAKTGRSIDVDASWNSFRDNVADDVAVGYNDQKSGWGNVWDHNTASNFRMWGLNFRGADATLPLPSLDRSPYLAVVTCNTAVGGPRNPKVGGGLYIGAVKDSAFANNTLSCAVLGEPATGVDCVQGCWGCEGNTWDGRNRPPRLHPAAPAAGVC